MRQQQSVATAGISLTMPLAGSPSPQSWKGRRLLWVDDSRLLLSLYKSVFESLGFEVLATSSPEEALQCVSSDAADVAILDFDMPEMDGGMLASLMKARCPMLPVILYSGSTSISPSAHHWVDAICAKGAPRQELLSMIERLALNAGAAHGVEPPPFFTPSSNH